MSKDDLMKSSVYLLRFEILRQYPDVSLMSAHVALQHHERWDGNETAWLAGDNIIEYARIVHM